MPEDRRVLDRRARVPDRQWRFGSAAEQVADVYLPARPGPTSVPVILVHGGFWRPEYDRAHLRPMAEALAAQGHPTVLVEYSRRPGDPDATLADLRQALARIDDVLDGEQPVLVGHSAGGHLALVLACAESSSARACLALAPVADLAAADRLELDDGAVRAFLGVPAAKRPDLDPVLLPAPTVPVVVVHGTDDSLVPIGLSDAYGTASGSRIVRLPDTAHFELIDPASHAWPRVIAELTALTAAPGIE